MDRKPKKRSRFYYLFAIVLGLALCTGLPALFLEAESVAKTEVRPLQPSPEAELVDDPLAEKTHTPFDPNHVHRRLFGDKLINLSAAVVRLDVTGADPEKEAELLKLRPSYADAIATANDADRPVLPSVNLLDGKAKQFDDGLYAALDQAYYKGLGDRLVSHVELVRRFHEEVGKDSPAAPFLAAALELAGVSSEATDGALKEQ